MSFDQSDPSRVEKCKQKLFAFIRLIRSISIAYKISFVLVSLSLVTLSTMWVIVSSNLNALLEEMSDAFGSTIVSQVASASAEPILAEDLLSLKVIVSQLHEAPNVKGAVIFDVDENILSQSGKLDLLHGTHLRPVADPESGLYMSAIYFKDVIAGYALVYLDKMRIKASIDSALHWMGVATLIIMLVCMLIAIYLGKHIAEPVKQLTFAAKAIHDGHLGYRISSDRYDEIGTLINSFNIMADGLKERRQLEKTFQRYVSPTVANNILSDLENPMVPTRYVNATVLFVDIVGFTAMCETFAADEVASVLNQYYGYILRAATVYRGTLDKFIGDGAMVIFGSPEADEEHCLHSVMCAQLFLELVGHFNELRHLQGLPIIEFRLGIHAGEMLAGSLGSMQRMQYTVIGDTVNIAARLCHSGSPGRILISDTVFDQSGGAALVNAGESFSLEIRGRSSAIQVYLVESLKAPFGAKIRRQVDSILENMGEKRNLLA